MKCPPYATFALLLGASLVSSASRLAAQDKMPAVPGTPLVSFTMRHLDMKVGTGELMAPKKCVYVNYTGWLTNGTKFDSSRDTLPNGKPKNPIAFAQGAHRVIAGWELGFEGMHVGGTRRLFIPYQLAYGEAGRPPVIPAKSELVFDVELMALADAVPAPKPAVPLPRGQPAPPAQCPTWAVVSAAK